MNATINTTKTSKILNRVGPCRCGCKGSDSWHAKSFKRVVRNVRPATGTATVRAFRSPVEIAEEGEAKFPWGTERVVRWVMVYGEGERSVRGWAVAS